MFTTTKALTDAQEALANMTSERDAATVQVTSLTAERDAGNAKVTDLTSQLATATSRITELETANAKATQDLEGFKADFDTKLNAAVIERCAKAGLDSAIVSDPNAGAETTMKRADFEKLDHKARGAFFAAGGKLTE